MGLKRKNKRSTPAGCQVRQRLLFVCAPCPSRSNILARGGDFHGNLPKEGAPCTLSHLLTHYFFDNKSPVDGDLWSTGKHSPSPAPLLSSCVPRFFMPNPPTPQSRAA